MLAPDGEALYSGITRARDPAFLTMVGGPGVPPFLGFVATPTLHDELAARRLALIGNGDVLAVDSDLRAARAHRRQPARRSPRS